MGPDATAYVTQLDLDNQELVLADLKLHMEIHIALSRTKPATGSGAKNGSGAKVTKAAPDGSSGQKRSMNGGGGSTRVFIGQSPGGRSRGLSDDVKDEDLRTYFERYGTVTGIAQHRWEDSWKKKGFGYIEFAEYEAAQAALGIHTVVNIELEVKHYTQGRAKTGGGGGGGAYNGSGMNSDYGYGNGGAGAPSYGYGYGYGSDNKRARSDQQGHGDAQDSAASMEQMKTMMAQMQQMQGQMAPGSATGEQMSQMQQQMYSMMQNQYMAALGGSTAASAYPGYPAQGAQSYQYQNTKYPKPPKPPGTDRF
jgi:RNA recognition motif-containing protein